MGLWPRDRDREAALLIRPQPAPLGAAKRPENANKTQAVKGQNSTQTQERGLRYSVGPLETGSWVLTSFYTPATMADGPNIPG